MDKMLQKWLVPFLFFGLLFGAAQWWARSAPPPDDLGVVEGQLRDCGDATNCALVELTCGDLVGDALFVEVMKSVRKLPRLEIEQETMEGYAHVVQRSAFWGFPDDVELLLKSTFVRARSEARRGSGDFGVNAKRLTDLQEELDARC